MGPGVAQGAMVRRCVQAGVRRDVPAAAEEDGEVKEWIFLPGCASRFCSLPCGAKRPPSARTAATVPGTRPRCCAQMLGCGRSQRGSHQKRSPFTWNATTSGTSLKGLSPTSSTCGTCTCPTTVSTRWPQGPCGIWAPRCACWTSRTTS